MKALVFFAGLLGLIVSCSSDSGGGTPTYTYSEALGTLNSAAGAMTSAGAGLGTAAASNSLTRSAGKSVVDALNTETTSDALSYCSQYGRAWNSSGDTARTPTETDHALHMIECTGRIDESTETPIGFLTQMAFVACILEDAGADLDTAGTYSNISVNPSQAAERCNVLTKTNIKEDDQIYTFDAVVSDNPNAAWDKLVTLQIGSTPFKSFYIATTDTALAIKALGYDDGGNPEDTVEITVDQGAGSLLFEFTSIRNFGHTRIKIDGTIASDNTFSNVSNVQGIRIICGSTGCNNDSYEGATLNGALSGTLGYQSLQVNNSGNDCNVGAVGDGCAAQNENCGAATCISYSDPTTSTFADSTGFATDIADVTNGPLCFANVTEALAPTRSALNSCSL